MSSLVSRWRSHRRSPRKLFVGSVKRVFDQNASPASRRWCAFFALWLACPILLIPLVAKSPGRVGVVWLYILVAVAWPFVIDESIDAEDHRAEADRTNLGRHGHRFGPGLFVLVLEVALGLSNGWWNGWMPGVLRAMCWGVLIPGGLADVIAALVAIPLAIYDGEPIY
jgi:hypothetical protein